MLKYTWLTDPALIVTCFFTSNLSLLCKFSFNKGKCLHLITKLIDEKICYNEEYYQRNCLQRNFFRKLITLIAFKLLVDIVSHVLRDSTPCFVRPSIHPSVCLSVYQSHFTFFYVFYSLTSPTQIV